MNVVVSILAGLALAAAAGLRAFLPLLAVNLGARLGWVRLNPDFEFLGGDVALVALIVATLVELLADKIPLVDHLLDVGGTVIRPLAGVLAGLALVAELPKPVTVALALFFGIISLGTHLSRSQVRLGSTATTGGTANPAISGAEDVASGTLSLLAILVPVVAGLLFLILAVVLGRLVIRWRGRASRRSRSP